MTILKCVFALEYSQKETEKACCIMKKYKISYYIGAALSLAVGIWHFFVPSMFMWDTYIPYKVLTASVNYVNLCFSFLLCGISLIMLLWGKKVFGGNREAAVIFGFFVLLWIFRVTVALLNPMPPEANVFMSYGQLVGSVVVMILLVKPFAKLMISAYSRKNDGVI